MSIQFGLLTRGSGKVYLDFTAAVPEGGLMYATSQAEGASVPALVLAGPASGHYVLVVSALDISQNVTICIVDASGNEIERCVKSVSHTVSALTSKFNTFSKKEGIEDIRNLDCGLRDDVAEISTKFAVFVEEDKERVMLVRVSVLYRQSYSADIPLQLVFFDKMGARVVDKDAVVLRDEVKASTGDATQRVVELSCQIPDDLWSFTLWAHFDDPRVPDGFVFFTEDDVYGIKRYADELVSITTGCGYTYEGWFLTKHRATPVELAIQREHKFAIEPVFSIIVPLYETPIEFFAEMADSVLAQTYGKFELVLVNASPGNAALCEAVDKLVASDARVKVVTLEENLGITENTNAGIRASSGDFLAFFDHDDVLEPNLLFEYAKGINEYPNTDLLYCDEDKLQDGHFNGGMLKPDFDWALICSCNFVTHLLCVRKSVVDSFDELPGKKYDGSQDHNMTIRVAEVARNIYHARKILYHWRIHSNSTASSPDAKPYTIQAGNMTIQEHFDRMGIPARIVDDEDLDNFHMVEFILPEKPGKISIIIPNKDCIDYLQPCLESIYEQTAYPDFEVIVVENNSEDAETFRFYEQVKKRYETLKVVACSGEFNFSAICNVGAQHATGEYLLFLNNDTKVLVANWLELMRGHLQVPDVSVVGAKLLFPNMLIQHVGIAMPCTGPVHLHENMHASTGGYFSLVKHPCEMTAVTGACLLTRDVDFKAVGGFDEELPIAYNDVDYCLKQRARKMRVVVEPRAQLIHYESVSRGYDDIDVAKSIRRQRDMGVLMQRYPKYFAAGDPFYNNNLQPGSTHYQLGGKSELYF